MPKTAKPARAAIRRRPLPPDLDRLLTYGQVADVMGTTVRKLRTEISGGRFPKPASPVDRNGIRFGDPRWALSSLAAWLAEHRPELAGSDPAEARAHILDVIEGEA